VRALLGLAALVLSVASLPAAAVSELYVGNSALNSVSVYSRTATGDVAPVRTLSGALTGLSYVQAVAVDVVNGELFVASGGGPKITVYDLTSLGNIAPKRTIAGASTGLAQPLSFAVDTAHDELIVGTSNATVVVFDRNANGDIAPKRTLSTLPQGSNPNGITLDLMHDEIVVATSASTIDVYSRTAKDTDAPLRSLGGALTGLQAPLGIGVDVVHDELFVANLSVIAPTVTVYSRTAMGNTSPIRTLAGASTGLVGPHALALDLVDDELFIANTINENSITVYPRNASGDTAPLRRIAGASTGIFGPTGVAVTVPVNVSNLDIDGSATATKYDALTDGLLVIRYLFGLTGASLTSGALGATATRTDPVAIQAYLDGIRADLDIDGSGAADALTDGLLAIRYLFGVRGAALIAGAIDPLATRKTAAEIETYLQTLVP
jgi:hypothetical protein